MQRKKERERGREKREDRGVGRQTDRERIEILARNLTQFNDALRHSLQFQRQSAALCVCVYVYVSVSVYVCV